MSTTLKSSGKSNPPIRLVTQKPQTQSLSTGQRGITLRQAGIAARPDMPAGKYKLTCESGRIIKKWSKTFAELSFCVVDGEFLGTVLSMWIPIFLVGESRVYADSKYVRQCEIALGRAVDNDDLNPDQVFVGKIFLADVSYRSTDSHSKEHKLDPTKRKSASDFLRVTALLSLESL